ncbi:SDR family oxidoreductase [Nocardioides litoris]|uniref:SDR family oxidoreductase n=1 Tax=Nocardioides litoris TaxID=1926648 RepID=UPI00112228F0|nr:NAD(P)H-binding protein [Nocardioides litoris]
MEPFVIHSSQTSGLRWLRGVAVGFTVFSGAIAVACVVGLLTRDLPATSGLYAAVIGAMAAYGVLAGVRWTRGLRGVAEPVEVARLDAEGLHLHEGAGVPDLPDRDAWTTVPWSWIASVTHSTLDLRTVKDLGAEVPLEVLRFTVADDRLLERPPVLRLELEVAARLLCLTPGQARTALLGEAGATSYADAVRWVQQHQPHLPTLSGTTLPWSNRAQPDAWPDSPRIAVVGASGRLGREVLRVLGRREKAPPVALARNEAHRSELERLGAEVRMVDLTQGPLPVGDALRDCTAVVHLAPTGLDAVVESADRAGVSRLLVVPAGPDAQQQVGLAAASGLHWTAFVPSALTDAAPTGQVALGEGVVPGPVPRTDLAEVLVAAIRDFDSVGAAWPIAGARADEGTGSSGGVTAEG